MKKSGTDTDSAPSCISEIQRRADENQGELFLWLLVYLKEGFGEGGAFVRSEDQTLPQKPQNQTLSQHIKYTESNLTSTRRISFLTV
ncbi:MAG: hypothetical protein AMJ91_05250 [candidate division Zixibacteria bacterium SM23_73_3]|nr:MAG: hypothetical protein AMJ91_05250 [candidate division Zixibacteria bacterium SM23_73_3]